MYKYEGIHYHVHGKYACFYGGCLSQWFKATFSYGDIVFNCAEQAMMYRKADFFKDKEIMQKIMQTNNPKEQKALGRQVKNFDVKKWNNVARDIVYKNNLLKFTQNQQLQEVLMSTENLIIVEASPYDTIWGIGRSLNYPNLQDESHWRGKNWLGYCLTEVRDQIKIFDLRAKSLSNEDNNKYL